MRMFNFPHLLAVGVIWKLRQFWRLQFNCQDTYANPAYNKENRLEILHIYGQYPDPSSTRKANKTQILD